MVNVWTPTKATGTLDSTRLLAEFLAADKNSLLPQLDRGYRSIGEHHGKVDLTYRHGGRHLQGGLFHDRYSDTDPLTTSYSYQPPTTTLNASFPRPAGGTNPNASIRRARRSPRSIRPALLVDIDYNQIINAGGFHALKAGPLSACVERRELVFIPADTSTSSDRSFTFLRHDRTRRLWLLRGHDRQINNPRRAATSIALRGRTVERGQPPHVTWACGGAELVPTFQAGHPETRSTSGGVRSCAAARGGYDLWGDGGKGLGSWGRTTTDHYELRAARLGRDVVYRLPGVDTLDRVV